MLTRGKEKTLLSSDLHGFSLPGPRAHVITVGLYTSVTVWVDSLTCE